MTTPRAWAIATVVALGAAWELAIRIGLGNPALLPPPSAIGMAIADLVTAGDIWPPAIVTLKRLFIGFFICVAGGTALGILTGSVRILGEMVEPLLEVVRSLPKVALVPALILFVGIGDATNIISIALAGLFPVWVNVVRAVRHMDPVLRESAITLGLGGFARLRKVVFPAVLPSMFAGARISLGLCFVVAVLSEMTIGSDGIGSLIIDMQRSFRVRQMYGWIVILAALGICINASIVAAERRIVFWTGHKH